MKANFALRAESSSVPTLLLSTGTSILGRSSKCDLVVKHDTVSRRHAEIMVTQNAFNVRDLESTNGIFIDNERVLTGAIRVGQQVKFGNVAFLLTLAEGGLDESNSGRETAHCAMPSARDIAATNLSKAQRRVLALLLQGLPEKQVAGQLKISPTTVHNHIQAIYRAFKVHSRPELLARFLMKNDTEPDVVVAEYSPRAPTHAGPTKRGKTGENVGNVGPTRVQCDRNASSP